ncbi:MAG: HAMP domain-containing protein [Candidatus Glassbacteria bacterium]|nr:HAMP domain-containing protein [Candidatus Glassbacteria bacterium]
MPRNFKLRTRIIVAFVAFVVPMIAASGLFYYETARRSLDTALGERLTAVAQATASRFNPLILSTFEPGDEDRRNYLSYRRSLLTIKEQTGLRRLYLFDPQGRSLIDTEEGIPIGSSYAGLRFQGRELETVLAGDAAASVLFRGEDGAWYKSGFAPVPDGQGQVAAVVGADAGAEYLDLIAGLGRSIFAFVLLGAALSVAIGFLLARTVSRPVHRLVAEADRIGHGRMGRPVEIGSRGVRELAVLAEALNRMRERLSEREENLRLMVAGVAHEIRNPLGGVELFASLARQEVAPGSEAAGYLDRVIGELNGLKAIINHFLEYARPAPPAPTDFDPAAVAAQAAALVRAGAGPAGAGIVVDIPESRFPVHADRDQLSRVLLNLLTNALAALPPAGGRVAVSARSAAGGMVALEVADNGCGMDIETVKKIFHPFFTTRDQGAGLGLAIVKKTVEENDGAIEVESSPGQGSLFTILLPAARGELKNDQA